MKNVIRSPNLKADSKAIAVTGIVRISRAIFITVENFGPPVKDIKR